MKPNIKVGTLVTVFGEHPGVVVRGMQAEGHTLVLYSTPTGKVRAAVADADVKERK